MIVDTIFPPDVIKDIQVTELSEIASLTIEQLAQRIDSYQKASRELYLRMGKASEELHRRLSEKNNEELDSLIEKVPQAESMRRSRGGYDKPKKPTIEDKVKSNAKFLSRQNPEMKAFLESLKAESNKKG